LNFPVVTKSVTAKVKKVEIELATSLCWHGSTATVNHPRETIKRHCLRK